MLKIKVHIDCEGFNIKPKDKVAIIKPRLQSNSTIEEVTLEELSLYIQQGRTISPAVMCGGAKSENWSEQQLFMVDIDNEIMDKDTLTIDNAIEISDSKNIPISFYYYSFNSSKDKPKFRLGFIANEIIKDSNIRCIIQDTLANMFSQSDKSCINADRIFFGTNTKVKVLSENTFTIADILKASEANVKNESALKCQNDNELAELKNRFDFLGYLIERNGTYKEYGNYIVFECCELCNHHKDLVYFKNSKLFKCFSANGGAYGSIIDYIMASQNMTLRQAIEYFKYDLLQLERETMHKNSMLKPRNNKSCITSNEIQNKLKDLEAEKYSLDDKSTSKLFAEIYKEVCRYCKDIKKWFVFNGKYWTEGDMLVKELCKEFKDEMVSYISFNYKTISNEDEIKKGQVIGYYSKLGQLNRRENIIKDAQSVYPINSTDFDKDIMLFNCQNGTINLDTGEFYPHNPKDMISRISNVIYDKNSTNNIFQNYITQIIEGNAESIKYIQKFLGLCLTGDTRNESFHIFYGKPRSGKSTVSTTYAYMLGGEKGYAMTVQPETLTQKKFSNSSSANSDIARLKGCRFLVCNELQQDMQLNVPLIKSFTGGDRLTARFLYGEHIEFSPAFKLILVTNHLPYVSDDTLFSSNRVCVIPFDYQIAEIDVDLKNKLKENEVISGAFNWCLKGLRAYKEEGLLAPPDIIKATIQYAQEGDTTEKFIKESLVYSPECNYSLKGIYGAYCDFCHKNNLPCDQKTLFKSKLEAKNMLGHNLTTVDTKRAESNVVRGYKIS